MTDLTDFEQVAITRDLVRRPEIKVLAYTLAKINSNGPIDRDNIPPLYVTLAYRLITHRAKREALTSILEALT